MMREGTRCGFAGDVGDALRRVLDTIDRSIAAHHQAADLAEQARELLSVAGSGSNQADVEHVCTWFTRVIEGITEPEGQVSTLATAADEIRSYLHRHGISHETSLAGITSASAPAPAAPTPEPGSAEHVDALRAQLPSPVQQGTGQKTHGRWFVNGQSKASAVVSGRDENSQAIDDLLRDEYGLPANRRLSRTGDVEQKIAVQMRQRGIRHATVTINNVPCRGEFSCESLVPVILPEGSTLTVYGTNGYRRTFAGGQQPPWKR